MLRSTLFLSLLVGCGSPIPDNYPPLDDDVGMHLTFDLDGTPKSCRDASWANSRELGFFGICEGGGMRIVIGTDDVLGEKPIDCDDTEFAYGSDTADCATSGTLTLDGYETEYAWGRFYAEFPAYTISNGMFSIRHRDKGVAVP